MARYESEFPGSGITVPCFLFSPEWQDCSWHNDVCPRFHNEELRLCVWVDYDDPGERELNCVDGPYEENVWKKFNVVQLIPRVNDAPDLSDEVLFSTEDPAKLESWLDLYAVYVKLNEARDKASEFRVNYMALFEALSDMVTETERRMKDLDD